MVCRILLFMPYLYLDGLVAVELPGSLQKEVGVRMVDVGSCHTPVPYLAVRSL